MLYLVQASASMERANAIDAGEGPGPVFAKIAERFHPEAFYGNATKRQAFMVVNLDTPPEIAELMYILTWFAGAEPTFTPIMRPEMFSEAIANGRRSSLRRNKSWPQGHTSDQRSATCARIRISL